MHTPSTAWKMTYPKAAMVCIRVGTSGRIEIKVFGHLEDANNYEVLGRDLQSYVQGNHAKPCRNLPYLVSSSLQRGDAHYE